MSLGAKRTCCVCNLLAPPVSRSNTWSNNAHNRRNQCDLLLAQLCGSRCFPPVLGARQRLASQVGSGGKHGSGADTSLTRKF